MNRGKFARGWLWRPRTSRCEALERAHQKAAFEKERKVDLHQHFDVGDVWRRSPSCQRGGGGGCKSIFCVSILYGAHAWARGACFARSRRAWEPLPRLLCGSPRSNATNAVPPPMCPRVPCDVRGVPRSRACGHMRRQDSGSSRAGVGKLRHGRTSKRELRRLWTRSIVIKRCFPRGVSSWALSIVTDIMVGT